MKKTISQRNVEKLLRELMPGWDEQHPLKEAASELSHEWDRRVAAFENSAPMRLLKTKIDQAEKKYATDRDRRVAKLTKVRREYWAKGLTPQVAEKLAKLVEEFDR